jgi:hypothetical protein
LVPQKLSFASTVTDRYRLLRDTRAARSGTTDSRWIHGGSFKIGEARISTRIKRRQNRAARCSAAGDKNSTVTCEQDIFLFLLEASFFFFRKK